MKFSFESPLALLPESLNYNDYEYSLVHLFDKYPSYLAFYEGAILDREMYLDNSAYELGESFDPSEYLKWVKHFANIKAENLCYFLPDYPGDMSRTLEAARKFEKVEGASSIGVIHGSSFAESLECAEEMAKIADRIAIPMLPDSYNDFNGSRNSGNSGLSGESLNSGNSGNPKTLKERTHLRISLVRLICKMKEKGKIPQDTKIHILGCLLPQEFGAYKKENLDIFSVDTSNPVIHGMELIPYKSYGLDSKSDTKLQDVIESEISPQQREMVLNNISEFLKLSN